MQIIFIPDLCKFSTNEERRRREREKFKIHLKFSQKLTISKVNLLCFCSRLRDFKMVLFFFWIESPFKSIVYSIVYYCTWMCTSWQQQRQQQQQQWHNATHSHECTAVYSVRVRDFTHTDSIPNMKFMSGFVEYM